MAYFRRLELSHWQQFQNIDIDFHDRLTILTGANGSGKTTILNLLGRHLGWNVPSLAVPPRSSSEIFRLTRFFSSSERPQPQVGTLTYDNQSKARLIVPEDKGPRYDIEIDGQQEVRCFFLPSHRGVYRYKAIAQIPAERIGKKEAFQQVWDSTRRHYFGELDQSPSYRMKEILIAWSFFGRGNSDMAADHELFSFYEGFQKTLGLVLPSSLGFRRLSIRNMEVVVECEAGEFIMDAASGGLGAIIDLAWYVFMFSSSEDEGFTVLVDEIENHLHPVMQKRILSDFLNAFPNVRFVVSTHSPLIVNSVRSSAVYALGYNTDRRIRSTPLDFVNHARTATQILDEVLGVSSTLPAWAEDELQTIVNSFASSHMGEAEFKELRRRLSGIGLGDYLPQALGKLLDSREQ